MIRRAWSFVTSDNNPALEANKDWSYIWVQQLNFLSMNRVLIKPLIQTHSFIKQNIHKSIYFFTKSHESF